MILLAFAVALLLAAFGAWSHSRQAAIIRVIVPLSGLGDAAYYTTISENDFYSPALVFPEIPRGIFRRTVKPMHREDGKMLFVAKESSGKFSVYTDAKPKPGPTGGLTRRWYLKTTDNHYVEFGERKFWPSYAPAKS